MKLVIEWTKHPYTRDDNNTHWSVKTGEKGNYYFWAQISPCLRMDSIWYELRHHIGDYGSLTVEYYPSLEVAMNEGQKAYNAYLKRFLKTIKSS